MPGGILPVARYDDDTIVFLFGREAYDGNWSDFGGSKEGNESSFQTAVREGVEELNGFIGTETEIRTAVKQNKLPSIEHNGYTTFLVEMNYDPKLPYYFANNNSFIKKHLPHLIDQRNGLFEKSEIDWFSIADLKRSRNTFRRFYRGMVDKILNQSKNISKKIDY